MTDLPDAPAQPAHVYICPGCGARYAEPTTCTNQHPPIEAEPFELQPGEDPQVPAAAGEAQPETAAEPEPEPAQDEKGEPEQIDQAPEHVAGLTVAHAALTDAHAALTQALVTLEQLIAPDK